MDIQRLKEYILENDLIQTILEAVGCHHIKVHTGNNPYYSCANPDGDNISAITVYQNEYLSTINYTRDIGDSKTDLFSLVEFLKNCSFFEAVKEVCSYIGLDYYHDFDEEMPESIRLAKMILDMQDTINSSEVDRPIHPISEKILTYYEKAVNDMFLDDGIDYSTQQLFEIGYDDATNRITIPIRDEIGTLVGVKGRLFSNELSAADLKYLYIEPCARNQILYGLCHTYTSIKSEGRCYVGEAEKSCMQLWSMGIHNSVAIGGKKISSHQIEKLTRLCTDIIFLFDKDVSEKEIKAVGERFLETTPVYAVIDKIGILDEKESPTDNPEKLKKLLHKCCYKIN